MPFLTLRDGGVSTWREIKYENENGIKKSSIKQVIILTTQQITKDWEENQYYVTWTRSEDSHEKAKNSLYFVTGWNC